MYSLFFVVHSSYIHFSTSTPMCWSILHNMYMNKWGNTQHDGSMGRKFMTVSFFRDFSYMTTCVICLNIAMWNTHKPSVVVFSWARCILCSSSEPSWKQRVTFGLVSLVKNICPDHVKTPEISGSKSWRWLHGTRLQKPCPEPVFQFKGGNIKKEKKKKLIIK